MASVAYKYDSHKERREKYGGRIICMSPSARITHNFVVGNIYTIFKNFLKGKQCKLMTDGADVFLSDDEWVVPDIAVVCDRNKIKIDAVHGAPDLIVEVLSPRTAKYDRGDKKAVYEQYGVREYWIVDVENEAVEVYSLVNGKFKLADVYIADNEARHYEMTEDDKNALVKQFSPEIFPELVIEIADVFDGCEMFRN